MRNHTQLFLYVLLSATVFSALTGCQSTSSDSGRWLTSGVRGQTPAWNGNQNPDAFSSSQVVAVPETPLPTTMTPVTSPTPYARDPFLTSAPNPFPISPQYSQTELVPATSLPTPTVPVTPEPMVSPINTLPVNTLPVNTSPINPLPTNMLPSTVSAIPPDNDFERSATVAMSQASLIDREHPWDLPAGPNTVEPIPTFSIQPAHSGAPLPVADPWGFGNPNDIQKAVSIEEQAKREEDEMEKARLAELATTQRKDGTPVYLQPLPKWNGPFETREQQHTIEQDIIRQVGYSEEKPKGFDNLPVYDWEKEEQKGFDWSILDPVNFFTKIRDWVGLGPDETKANAAMKKGREILLSTPDLKDHKKCLEAAKLFSEAAKRYPDSLLEEDALHLAGECYFFGEDYPRAMKSYQKLLIKYQHSKYVDNGVRRLFAIARYWEQEDWRGVSSINMTEKSRPAFDTFGYAKKAYETIFINDPNGPISDAAVMALATAYLRKGRYKGDDNYNHAAYYYSFLRENYPLSKYITKAHEFELEARTQAYMGAEHSSSTLDEAQKLADITLRQFNSELDDGEKEEILEIKEEIIQRQAEREWIMGQFYDKKQYYGSAKLYYEKLLDKYPQTEYAEKARVRLEQIQNKPDQPDQLDFLKKIFRPRGT
ncbi:MAG: tetratricopeptide repeat protein [Planctomycetaceae bacterium]|nr:tetratricopeptide repeat protein [Planctomycetaceae bacterium]